MIIETERLRLSSPHEVKAEAVCDYYTRNRAFLARFSPAREDSFFTLPFQAVLVRAQALEWEAGREYRFYLTRKGNDSRIIGTIALTNVIRGVFLSCFLGYQLDEEQVNRGYMTEAAKRTVRFAFEDLGLHRVEANIIPRNAASRAVAEKSGFAAEGISREYLKINGKWEDHIHYVILNRDL